MPAGVVIATLAIAVPAAQGHLSTGHKLLNSAVVSQFQTLQSEHECLRQVRNGFCSGLEYISLITFTDAHPKKLAPLVLQLYSGDGWLCIPLRLHSVHCQQMCRKIRNRRFTRF